MRNKGVCSTRVIQHSNGPRVNFALTLDQITRLSGFFSIKVEDPSLMLGLVGRRWQLDGAVHDHVTRHSTLEAHIINSIARASSMVLAILKASLTIYGLWWISSKLFRLLTLGASTLKWILPGLLLELLPL